MKRIISLILTIAIIFISCSFTYAKAESLPENFDEMKGVLTALSIIDETNADMSKKLTRGEFTSLVIKAAGLSPYASSASYATPFSDVSSENPYASYISMAKERGLSLGYSDGTFRPDESITLIEAIVYFIRLMGYTDVAQANNGYPGGYQTQAKFLGFTDNVDISYTEALNLKNAIILIFNALNARVALRDAYKTDGGYNLTYGSTLMYQSFKVAKVSGVMDEVDISALSGPNNLSPWTVSVDGVVIDIGELSPNYLLGYNVNAYYEDADGKNVLKYVWKNIGKNSVKTVKISDIINISGYTIEYEDEYGKSHYLKYNKGAAILYNGVATKSPFNTSIYLDANGNKLSGYIELIDNNADGSADVVSVCAYEEFIAGKKSSSDNIIYDKNDASNKKILDIKTNDPYTIIYNGNGEEISLSKVAEGMSIVILSSKPDAYQGYIRAYVSEEKKSGHLDEISDVNNDKLAVIDGKTYTLSQYAEKYLDSFLVGREVTAVLNKFGEIAFIDAFNPDGSKWGMLLNLKQPRNFGDTVAFYIYTDTGVIAEIEPAKYVKLDNREKKYDLSVTEDLTAFNGILSSAAALTDTRPQASTRLNIMIKYRLNGEGKLISVDTVLNSDGDAAVRADMTTDDSVIFDSFTDERCTSSAGYYTLGTRLILNKNDKVFLYPSDDSPEGYNITECVTAFNNNVFYTGYAFYSNPDSTAADAYALNADGLAFYTTSSTASYMSMVVKITDTVDEEGALVKKLYLYHGNELKSYLCDPELLSDAEAQTDKKVKIKELVCGDIIYCAVNSLTNKLQAFQLRYDSVNDKIYNTYVNSQYITKGYAYLTDAKGMHYVMCDTVANILTDYNSGNYRAAEFLDTVQVTVYDKSKKGDNRVAHGSVDDILSYAEAKNNCSKLIVHTYSTSYHLPRSIFIIK